jgi:ligand-binding sensor domain-containing protein
MKIMFKFSFLLFLFAFTHCKKDEIPRDYLFDGLPYYFSDTLFYKDGSSRKVLNGEQIELDSKGILWISSGYSIIRYNPVKEEILPLDYDNFAIWSFYIDSRDRVWGGSYGSICMFDDNIFKRFYFDDPNVLARSIGEDAEGKIHFNGYENGQEYTCDGQSIVRTKPIFAPEEYSISKIFSDKEGSLWYFIDMTPSIEFDNKTRIVRYHNDTDYDMLDTIPTSLSIDMLKYRYFIDLDTHNSPVFFFGGMLGRINSDMKWETLWKPNTNDSFVPSRIGVDPLDNIWVSLSRQTDMDPRMSFLNNGKWVMESPNMKVIRDHSVAGFAFPDNNAIWIATSGGIFEFKK